ncbi:MAG: M23 family metallopeptidase [Anaerolineae bacterium]|nr:M23 family metallopeptidase [Anaerolineae bacterium]
MILTPAGILAGDGPVRPEDLQVIREAGLAALKLRALANPVGDVTVYRDAGVRRFLLQLLSPRPGTMPTSPEEFVGDFAPAVSEFLKAGVTDLELHGEPNSQERGWGVSWNSAAEFSDWFLAVAELLRSGFGPQLRIGFPGLAPPGAVPPGVLPAIDDETFLSECAAALTGADFVCCHVYWRDQGEMRDFHGALRFLRTYLERAEIRPRPVVISEFANVATGESFSNKGRQYAEFYFLCSQYDRLDGAYAFLLRSPDPAYASMAWLDDGGAMTPIVERVARRPLMPPAADLRLEWPTVSRAYTQAFGDRQQLYYDASYDPEHDVHWLHGGHEGVDLRAVEGSPVKACLPGQVTCGAPGTAYGNFVRVSSPVAGVGAITLLYAHMQQITAEDGSEVAAGEVLGLAGQTGQAEGSHLHLGLKIDGVTLPPTSHYLNARPYLDALRGSPRLQYARTYVLLPPNADSSWARAAAEATWEERRFTVGNSADDAGIGDLDVRRIVAVNPGAWGDDLAAFFAAHYPAAVYVPVTAGNPLALADCLRQLPPFPDPPEQPLPPRGLPRSQYMRTYVLLPPDASATWARAAIEATWDQHRLTVGGSADDAGIGDLDFRRVIAINPEGWEGDLAAFFARYYPGVIYVPIQADTPVKLWEKLEQVVS